MSAAWVGGASAGGGTLFPSATVNRAHTVSAGSDRAILVRTLTIATSGGLVGTNSVVRNGQSFVKILEVDIGSTHRFTAWILVNPTVGTSNITFTFSRAAVTIGHVEIAENFTGVDQTTPVTVANIVSGSGTGATSYSANVPGTCPFLALTMTASDSGSSQWSLGSSSDMTTQRTSVAPAATLLMRTWSVDAASNPYTAEFSHSTATTYFFAAVPLNAAAGSSAYSRSMSATASALPSLGRNAWRSRSLSATTAPAATLARALTRRVTLAASAASVATLARATRFARGLSASGRGLAALASIARPLPKRLLATPTPDGVSATAKKR